MAGQVTSMQPTVLRWARESQGLSVAKVARFLKREPDEIIAWEAGKSAPTYAQLEKLAYELFKRPLAVFFLPAPPEELSPKKAFRTLPDYDLKSLTPDTLYQVRLASALQISLRELHEGFNPTPRKIFREVKLTPALSEVESQARMVRDYFGITLKTQMSWKSDDLALKKWRNAIEDAGIYVFKHAFKEKAISGFCLLDAEFPLIYLNNSATKTRQIFSLFHELGHLLLGVNGISKFETDYLILLQPREQSIERLCNLFAAELLIPDRDFSKQVQGVHHIEDSLIEELAKRYSVSREAVLRRMLDKNLVSRTTYEEKAKEWSAQKGKPIGGNYYATKVSYLGERYLQLVFSNHYQGKISLHQVAEYIGVKISHIPGIENRILSQGVVS